MVGWSRAQRLRGRRSFRLVFDEGRSLANRLAALYVRPTPDGGTRVGFVVSRRNGNAVTRNRLRRRMREILRLHWEELRGAWHLVLVARPPAKDAGFRELEEAVVALLRRSGVARGS